MTEKKTYYTPTEVARIFNVGRRSIYRWCESNTIGHIVLPGGHIRIPASEVARMQMLVGVE